MSTAVENKPQAPRSPIHSIGKLVALCAFAAMMSTFGPFALVAPAAIALAFIYYGLVKVVVSVVLTAFGLYFLGGQGVNAIGSIGTFVYSCLIGLFIDRLIFRKVHPVKGILLGGTVFYAGFSFLAYILLVISSNSLDGVILNQVNNLVSQIQKSPEYAEILSSGGDQARQLKSLVKSPELMVQQIVNWLPSVAFIGVFLSLWASFYFVLRNSMAWRSQRKYPFGLLHLTFFKLPFWLVYPLIIGLIFAVIGDSIEGIDFSVVGFNILYCLGSLYFFQGFGVFYDYLTVKGYRGLIKSLLITIAVVFMWRLVVLVGLLDLWINFRKFYVKKIEGEK